MQWKGPIRDVPALVGPDSPGAQPYSTSHTPYAPSWDVAAWFVDPSNATGRASNDNDGLTATTPLLTFAEIVRRWGTGSPVLRQDTTIFQLSDQPDFTDPVNFPVAMVVAPTNGVGTLTMKGTLTQLAAGQFSAVIPKNRSAALRWTITAAIDWAPFVNALVHDTDADAWFWVDSDLGGGSAIVSEPMQQGTPTNITPAKVVIHALDHFVVYKGSKVYLPLCTPTIATGFDSILWHLWILGPPPTGEIAIGSPQLIETRVDTFIVTQSLSGNLFTTNANMTEGIFAVDGTYIGGIIKSQFSVGFGGEVLVDGDCLVDDFTNIQGNLAIGDAYFGQDLAIPNVSNLGGGSASVIVNNAYYDEIFWGPAALRVSAGGDFMVGVSHSTFAAALLNTGGMFLDGATTASSYNLTTGAWTPGVTLNPAQLDAAVAGGGFGGIAYGNNGSYIRSQPS